MRPVSQPTLRRVHLKAQTMFQLSQRQSKAKWQHSPTRTSSSSVKHTFSMAHSVRVSASSSHIESTKLRTQSCARTLITEPTIFRHVGVQLFKSSLGASTCPFHVYLLTDLQELPREVWVLILSATRTTERLRHSQETAAEKETRRGKVKKTELCVSRSRAFFRSFLARPASRQTSSCAARFLLCGAGLAQ